MAVGACEEILFLTSVAAVAAVIAAAVASILLPPLLFRQEVVFP
jgi:hypothetical protein